MNARTSYVYALIAILVALIFRVATAQGGDAIAWGVVLFFVGVEGAVWVGWHWIYWDDSNSQRKSLEDARADLALKISDKARMRSMQ